MALDDNPFLNDRDDEEPFPKRKEIENPFVSEDDDDDDEMELLRNKSRQRTNSSSSKTLSGFKFPDDNENEEEYGDNETGSDDFSYQAEPETEPEYETDDAESYSYSPSATVDTDDTDDIFGDDDPFQTLSETETEEEDRDDGVRDFGADSFGADSFGGEDDEYYHEEDGTSQYAEFGDLAETDEDEDETRIGQTVFSGFDINKVLETAVREKNISDVHVSTHQEVSFTRLGEIEHRPEFGVPDGRTTRRVQRYLISHLQDQDFVREMDLDTSYVLKDGPYRGRRFRLNVALSFEEVALTFRVISEKIPTTEELGIGKELQDWFSLPAGLILINGPTGSGKSTTLASLLREVQLKKAKKIVTVEKPIEYVYPTDGRGKVVQREVEKDTRSFGRALSAAMRQAPKVVLIGEVRDQSELSELLRAAETGHLAISTMHTNSVPTAINRIKSMFDGEEQKRVLLTLSDTVQGIMNQALLKTPDGKGRFAVREILRVNPEIRDLIAEGNVLAIRAYQQKHKITMEHKLAEAVWEGRCTLEAGREQSVSPEDFDTYLREMQEEQGRGHIIREEY